MRIIALVAAGTLAACTSSVTVPREQVLYEIPSAGTASTAGGGGDAFVGTIEGSLAATDPAAAPIGPAGAPLQTTPLNADRINPMEFTLAQQRHDAAVAEQQLAAARAQLVVVQPSQTLPNRVEGVNIALYAQQSTNQVGERVYRRGGGGLGGGCGRYRSADDAQRAFLAAGGPQSDQLNLDSDGDGFACRWDPAPFRQLRL